MKTTLYSFQYLRKICLLLSGLLALSACETDKAQQDAEDNANRDLQDFHLAVVIQAQTENNLRSGPTGGEEGDGTEAGINNENDIRDVTVVLYEGDNINSSLNTRISEVFYIGPDEMLNANTSKVKRIKAEKNTYRALVIANAGDLTQVLTQRTVKQVGDYLLKSVWETDRTIYSNFVMTSVNDTVVDLTATTSETNPAVLYAEVQRMAARIDIIPESSEDQSNTYLIRNSTEPVAAVEVQAVKLMNRLTAGSWLIKRVAEGMNLPEEYLGKETPQAGIQTNYVMDPWIKVKTIDNLDGGHFDPDRGGAGTATAKELYSNYFEENFTLTDEDTLQSPITGKDFYILDYVMENTMQQNYQLNGYSTGVMYRAQYTPYVITAYNPATRANETVSNSDVITFFTTGENIYIYESLESAEAIYLQSGQPDDFFSRTFTAVNTWQEVSDYAKRLKDDDIAGFKNYLLNLVKENSLSDNLNREISWNAFVLSSFGYSNNETLQINLNGIDTKSLLKGKGIRTYESGICYYPYWIRHSNDNTIEAAMMEFGIVRNNVYKLQIESFSGLGKPDPYDPDTDNPENPDEEAYVRLHITVKPWKLILHPEIIL